MASNWQGALAFLAMACTGVDGDITLTATTSTGAPDVAGVYDVAWSASPPAGCAIDDNWVAGPLTISGTASALTFDFEEAVLDGIVEATFAYEVSGSAAGATVTGVGVAFLDGDRWMLEGDLTHAADASTTGCTFTGTMNATQTGVAE